MSRGITQLRLNGLVKKNVPASDMSGAQKRPQRKTAAVKFMSRYQNKASIL